MERLKYISLKEHDVLKAFEIAIQFSNGGAAEVFELGTSAEEVIYRLRQLADRLEKGIKDRS